MDTGRTKHLFINKKIARAGRWLLQDMKSGFRHDRRLAAFPDELVASQQVPDGSSGDSGARPERVDGNMKRLQLFGQAKHQHAHAVFADGVGHMAGEPFRVEVDGW